MEKLRLVQVSKQYEDKVMDYRDEFLLYRDSMDGTSGLRRCKSFREWEISLIENSNEETVRGGLVPATTLLAVSTEDDRLIGSVDIRHRLSEYLLNIGGHIGYSVRKTERNKGFATQILSLALKECLALNMRRVLLTCDKKNIASSKTIINNDGVLENEVEDDQRVVQRYWITL